MTSKREQGREMKKNADVQKERDLEEMRRRQARVLAQLQVFEASADRRKDAGSGERGPD